MSANGHSAESPPVERELTMQTALLVPISGTEAAGLQIVATVLESLQPFMRAVGVTGLDDYPQMLTAISKRWEAETGRPRSAA